MVWCVVCAIKKGGRKESTDIIGPFSDAHEMREMVKDRVREIRSEGLTPCIVPFELCSDDVPEVLHELTS